MYVIGLTGNIATGKSTVAQMLGRLGALVIDADKLAHWVMRAGTPVHRRIVEAFGPDILGADGEIDRRALGGIVFADAEALARLEHIVHPPVVEETLHRLAASDRPVGVVEAIKLLEAEMQRYCQAVWVVTAPREQQIERLVNTRGMTADQVVIRIEAQPAAELKVARADVVIDNGGTLEETWQQVVRAWNDIPGVTAVDGTMSWAMMLGD